MFRVALASVLGNKIRLAMTALAVVLGVAFVSGTFMLTDSMDRAFSNLFSDVYAGTDVYVNPVSPVDVPATQQLPGQGPTLDARVLEEVRAVDGVAEATGSVEGYAQVLGPDGEPVGGMGPPTSGYSWRGPDEGPFTLEAGRPADAPDEATLDAATADSTGYEVGDILPVLLESGRHEFELVGITGFGEQDNLAGSTAVTFTPDRAQELFDKVGEFDEIAVEAAEGVTPPELVERVEAAIDTEVAEATTGTEQAERAAAELQEGLSFLTTGLLAFAGVALFVAIFLITNTFSIIVAQRTREFALLRAVGASSRQVLWTVVVEALVVGVLAGVLGLVAGIGLSQLAQVAFDAAGFGFPSSGLTVEPRTVVASMLVALVVTTVAAVAPARRASRISPMEAMRQGATADADRVGTGRTVVGALLAVAGSAALVVGLAVELSQPLPVVGAGAAAMFVGIALLAPHLAGPVAAVVGWLPARMGVAGRLSRNNAAGNAKRTASTASALMIGVALVSFVSIFAASATASVNQLFAEQVAADFTLQPSGFGGSGVPEGVVGSLRELEETGAVSPVSFAQAEHDGEPTAVSGVSPADIGDLADVELVAGDLAGLGTGDVVVSEEFADTNDLAVGDATTLVLTGAGDVEVTVQGIYAAGGLLTSPFLASTELLRSSGAGGFTQFVFVDAAEGVDTAVARGAIESTVEDVPTIQVMDAAELLDSLRGQVDALLNVMIGLLALALLIALIGIVNTLALSVVERTREIGLLRAVGMTRSQVRHMVRWESVIVSVFGAALGVAVGALFGWALVTAGGEEAGLPVLEFPVVRLVVYMVVAAFAGVLAAVFPARRAARLDVLEAVTTE